jgi:hypothetical protein
LINFGLFGLFFLSHLEKSKLNQRTKTELAKIFNWTEILNQTTELNNLKFNDSVQNQLNRSVCTPLLVSVPKPQPNDFNCSRKNSFRCLRAAHKGLTLCFFSQAQIPVEDNIRLKLFEPMFCPSRRPGQIYALPLGKLPSLTIFSNFMILNYKY